MENNIKNIGDITYVSELIPIRNDYVMVSGLIRPNNLTGTLCCRKLWAH